MKEKLDEKLRLIDFVNMCPDYDPEILSIAEEISNNEIYHRLFEVARRSTDQQIIKFCEFMEAMNNT